MWGQLFLEHLRIAGVRQPVIPRSEILTRFKLWMQLTRFLDDIIIYDIITRDIIICTRPKWFDSLPISTSTAPSCFFFLSFFISFFLSFFPSLSLSLSLCIYIYINMYVCTQFFTYFKLFILMLHMAYLFKVIKASHCQVLAFKRCIPDYWSRGHSVFGTRLGWSRGPFTPEKPGNLTYAKREVNRHKMSWMDG